MKRKLLMMITAGLCLSVGLIPVSVFAGSQAFIEHCRSAFASGNAACPQALCQLVCADGSQEENCPKDCVPRDCRSIRAELCPAEFCGIVVDCSGQKNCLLKIPAEQVPTCGGLAYSAQDVPCCAGYVPRCGFDYLDGKCNMEGKGTAYRFPICIPCGDGVCTNFENHCNCPEDCPKDIIPL